MTYALVDGNMEGEHLGILPFATTIDPDTAVESYLGFQYAPKKGGALPSPRTAPPLQVAPSTAAALVSGNPGAIAPAVSAYLKRMQGADLDDPEEPVVRFVQPPRIGLLAAAAGGLVLLYLLRARR